MIYGKFSNAERLLMTFWCIKNRRCMHADINLKFHVLKLINSFYLFSFAKNSLKMISDKMLMGSWKECFSRCFVFSQILISEQIWLYNPKHHNTLYYINVQAMAAPGINMTKCGEKSFEEKETTAPWNHQFIHS